MCSLKSSRSAARPRRERRADTGRRRDAEPPSPPPPPSSPPPASASSSPSPPSASVAATSPSPVFLRPNPPATGGGVSSSAAARSMRDGTMWSNAAVPLVRVVAPSSASGRSGERPLVAPWSHGEPAVHARSSYASRKHATRCAMMAVLNFSPTRASERRSAKVKRPRGSSPPLTDLRTARPRGWSCLTANWTCMITVPCTSCHARSSARASKCEWRAWSTAALLSAPASRRSW